VCRVRQLPQEAAAIQQWLVNLPLKTEWKGEGLPSTSQRVFNELLRSERRSPTPAERKRILVEQDGRCYICGGIFDGPKENPRDAEFDHVSPLRMTVRGCTWPETGFCRCLFILPLGEITARRAPRSLPRKSFLPARLAELRMHPEAASTGFREPQKRRP
jgi:hypothetical protein